MLSREERYKLYREKEAQPSTGGKVLTTVNKPFQWINENIDKPWAATITAPFSPPTTGTEGMNWYERNRKEYEDWQAPKGAKFAAEMSNPIWWIPYGGIAGGIAKTALKARAPVAGAVVKAARGVQTAEKIVNLPGELLTKGAGKVAGSVVAKVQKPVSRVIPDNDNILQAMTRFTKKTGDDALDTIHDAFNTQAFVQEMGKNDLPVSLAKLSQSLGSTVDNLQDDVIHVFGLAPSDDIAAKAIGKQASVVATKVDTTSSRIFNDIISNPKGAKLTAIQNKTLEDIYNFSDELVGLLKAEKIDIGDFFAKNKEGRYFPRIVLGKVTKGKFYEAPKARAKMIGSLTSMEKERVYATALEGVQKGIVYADPITTLKIVHEGVFNRVANKRSGDILKKLTVTTGSRVNREIKNAYSQAVQASKGAVKAEAVINRALRGEDVPTVTIRSLRKVSPQLADTISQAMAVSVPQVDDVIRNLSRELKTHLTLTTDDILRVLNKQVTDVINPAELDKALAILAKEKNINSKTIEKIYNSTFNFFSQEKKDVLQQALTQAKQLKLTNQLVMEKAKGDYTRAKALAVTKGITEGRLLNVPSLQNRIFVDTETMTGREMADIINKKLFPAGAGKEIAVLNEVNSVARTLIASLDNSGVIIQGFPALGHDVSRWMRGEKSFVWGGLVKDSFRSLAKPSSLDDILIKNADFLSRHPTLITGGNEYYAGVGGIERILGKAPKVGTLLEKTAKETYGRTGTAFSAAGLSGRLSLAKSFEQSWAKRLGKEVADLTLQEISEVDNLANILTGSFSSKLAGVGIKQSTIESAVLFAPNYLRANLSVLREMLRGTATAHEARQAIGGMLWATFVGYHHATKAIGAPAYLNPAPTSLGGDGGKFLTIKIGETNYGLPGFWYSLMRTGASIAAAAKENPSALISVNWRENPELYFLMSRASPMVNLTTEIIEGKDFAGNNLDVRNPNDWAKVAGEKVLPIMAQNIILEENGEWQSLFGEFMGMRTFPVSDAERRNQLRNDCAQIEYGLTWEELPFGKQDDLERKYPDLKEISDTIKQEMSLQRGNDFQKAEYIVKQDIETQFRNDMNSLAKSWLEGNLSFNQYNDNRSEYLTRWFSGKDTVQQMKLMLDKKATEDIERYFAGKSNPMDDAMQKYYEITNNPVKDINGLIDWEATNSQTDKYLQSLDKETRDYILAHRKDWIKDLPIEAQQVELMREMMRELLVPYWNVRDVILNKNARLKELYDSYQKMKRTDPQKAQMMLKVNPVLANALSSLEKQIKVTRDAMRRSNKELNKAVMVWYS